MSSVDAALSSHLALAEQLRGQLLRLKEELGGPPPEGTPPSGGLARDRERLMSLARNLSDTEHLQQLCDMAEKLQAKENGPGSAPAEAPAPDATAPEVHTVGAVSVEFGPEAGQLGLSFEAVSDNDAPRIKAIVPDCAAAAFPELKVGLELVAIQGRPVVGMTMKECMAKIRSCSRPITLGFNQSAQTVFNGLRMERDRDGDYDHDDSDDSSAPDDAREGTGVSTSTPASATPTRIAVEFSATGKLGMSFDSDTEDGASPVRVTRVTSGSLAANDGRVRTGMVIARIGDADCTSWPLRQVVDTIKAAPRPLALEFFPEGDNYPSLVLNANRLPNRAEQLNAAQKDDDMYSPSGGARGGGAKVLAKAGGDPPPLGEYKLLANCRCFTGKELDAAPCEFSLDKDEIFQVQEVALVEGGVIRLRSGDG